MSNPNRRNFLGQITTLGLVPLIRNSSIEAEHDKNFKGKNKIGFNLLLWSAVVSEKMKPIASKLKEIGYDGIEVATAEESSQPYVDLGKFVKDVGLEISMVLAVGKDTDPINESQAIRDKGLEKIKWAIDRANDLGAKVICGPFHSAFANFRKRPPNDDEFKWSAEVLHKAGDYAAQSNIILAPEAINRFECYLCNTIDQLNRLVKLTDHQNVKPMFDTHHANIEEKNYTNAIKTLHGQLAHVHISENDRGTPGNGHVNFDNIFSSLAAINYKGWLTVEAFSRNDVNFANSINVWREYNKPWDIATNGIAHIKKMQQKYHL
ncbi:MAG TPA: sugar phosphate isomerase/epimerase family protein [Flavitalea sp.]|nr:sugar phosphate isomerase/epimerase family protein [Flavitalea sp.]